MITDRELIAEIIDVLKKLIDAEKKFFTATYTAVNDLRPVGPGWSLGNPGKGRNGKKIRRQK